MNGDDIEQAIEVFARGFAFTRSFTHPYHAQRVGDLWVVRDAPRKNPANYRREEWIARVQPATFVDAIARKETRGRYAICAIRTPEEPAEPLRTQYKALGYRLGTTEAVMVHGLKSIPRLSTPFPVHRVLSEELATALAKAAGRRQILPEHLANDAPMRAYAALDGQKCVGWARSIAVGECTWVSNVFVVPKYRRRGIAKSILAKMLRDDKAAGAKRSILTASHAGALLYPHVGFEMLGELLLFTPRRGR